MWTIFKLTNVICILISSYVWITSQIPMTPMMIVVDIIMMGCLSFLPIRFNFDVRTGFSLLFYVLLILWGIFSRGVGMGLVMASLYFPIFCLVQLPRHYQADLLRFVTKSIAILMIPALIIYWITLFTELPNFGLYVDPDYKPFINYIFYMKTTFDHGTFVRFNAFFLEPGVVSMVCLFLIIANNLDFKRVPLLWVLLTAIVFSFSLAGYLLTLTAIAIFKANTPVKMLTLLASIAIVVVIVMNLNDGDNAVNELIIERLEYDESKGIKGNNRYNNNTDYAFDNALDNGDYWVGIASKSNMDLISGSGIKIYILRYGVIGMIIVFALYLSLIPSHPNWPYTLKFLFVLMVCFIQNAYPEFYSWLFPYILGLNLNRKEDDCDEVTLPLTN